MRKAFGLVALVLVSALSGAAATREILSAYSPDQSSITEAGTADHEGWLGLSVYPKRGKTYSVIRYVHCGTLDQTFSVSSSYAGGTFEVALWEKRVPRSACKSQCSWCAANGCHMEGLRAYGSGLVGR